MSKSETQPVDPEASPAGGAANATDPLAFDNNVNEVFLLIDHISGRSEKSLKDIDGWPMIRRKLLISAIYRP